MITSTTSAQGAAAAPTTRGLRATLLGTANVIISAVVAVLWGWLPITLIVTGISAIPAFGLGVLSLIAFVYVMRAVFWVERQRSEALYGQHIPYPYRRLSRHAGFKRWIQQQWFDVSSGWFWIGTAHHYLKLLLGLVLAAAFAAPVIALGAATAPAGTSGPFGESTGLAFDGPLAIVVASLVPAAFVALALGLGRLDRVLDAALLRPNRTAELSAEVARVGAARQGAVDAAEVERLRIERDLHDGAQPRLVSLAMTLGMARSKFDSDPEGAKALLAEAHDESKAAVTDLRQVVRGIHPAILTDRGLDAALSALAARSPVPVELDVAVPGRLPPETEAVAYFVVSEALTNVAKHAGATRARVDARRLPRALRVTVYDDGCGGAEVSSSANSTGLRGLTDRVRSASGTFLLQSPAGGPTVLVVELPCAS